MRKTFSCFCLFLLSCCILSACNPEISVDKAENVKKVTASYSINESFQNPKNNLLKSAELTYTSMSIVASEDVKISGVSFDLKLATSGTENLYCIAYFYDGETKETTKLNDATKVDILEDYSPVNLYFSSAVNLTSGTNTDITQESSLLIHFYEDSSDKLNSHIIFSINNIKFIDNDDKR